MELKRRKIELNIEGSPKLSYLEIGEGDPILFLHGIPLHSDLWRKVMPLLAPLGRCLALDMLGYGHSDKPSQEGPALTLGDQLALVQAFIQQQNLERLTLVMHGSGSLPGLQYAMSHPDHCKGLVFYECFMRPLTGDALSLPMEEQLRELEIASKAELELLASGTNYLDRFLAQTSLHQLSAEDVRRYREPFLAMNQPNLHLLQYWQELPRGDGKSLMDSLLTNIAAYLVKSSLPKLLLYSLPGFVTTMATVAWAKKTLPAIEVAEVGEELHLAPETEAQLMGELMSAWLQAVEQSVRLI